MSDDDDTANIERALFRKAITEKDNLAALGFAMITGLKYHQPRAVAEAIEKVTPKSSDPAPITHLPASPSPKDSPSTANSAMPIVPPESSKSAILGTTDDNQPLQIGDMERRNGLYILGKPRMGKSWLISNLILQDIQNFAGVFFLDPHGDAIADIVPRINLFLFPQTCIILDPENEQYSFGINLLSCHDISSPKARSDTFARAKGVFDKLWKSTFEEKPWLQLILQNSLYALIENQGYTIAELPLFFTDSAFRDFICRNIKYNTVVADYWLKTFTAKTKSDQDAQLEAAQTRAEIMLAHPYVRDIVGQTKTTIDLR
jgi:hypothetical protein